MTLNFKLELDLEILIDGYRRVINILQDPALESWFKRFLTLIEHLEPVHV